VAELLGFDHEPVLANWQHPQLPDERQDLAALLSRSKMKNELHRLFVSQMLHELGLGFEDLHLALKQPNRRSVFQSAKLFDPSPSYPLPYVTLNRDDDLLQFHKRSIGAHLLRIEFSCSH